MSPKSPWSSSGHWFFAFRLKRLDVIIFIINHHHCCRYHCQNLDSKLKVVISRRSVTVHKLLFQKRQWRWSTVNWHQKMLFRSIRFCSFQFDCFSSAAFIFCSSITSCNWGHLSVLPNPVCTSIKMHQNASKVRKLVVKKLQILHKTDLSWSHACILRKRTSPPQRQFEDYTENNSHHPQKCKIIE